MPHDTRTQSPVLAARFAASKEKHVMTWTSDRMWVAIYSILAALLILSWAYIPA